MGNKLKWLGGGLAVVLVLVAALALLARKSVHTELIIKAPPQEVWAVVTDPTTYPEWNPILVEADGQYREGQTIAYKMRSPDGKTSDVTSTVTRLTPQRELRQFGGIRGVLTFEHQWLLEPVPQGTKLIQQEEYRGLWVLFWDPSWVHQAYRDANKALQARLAKSKPAQKTGQPAAPQTP